jgi:hypothetical protein
MAERQGERPEVPRPGQRSRAPHSGRRPGPAERAVGDRLWLIGRIMQVAGAIVLGVAALAAYRAYHDLRQATAVLAPMFAGGVLGFALLWAGEAATHRAILYLTGQDSVARSVGRLAARWLDRRRRRRRPPRF